jgi:flagellar hook-basal body complex protein FliE
MDARFNQASSAYSNTAGMQVQKEKLASLKESPSMPADAAAVEGKQDFHELITSALSEAKQSGYNTEALTMDAIADKASLHDLVTAVTNSELTLQTIVAVRDRAVSAYQDIIKMPI